MKYFLLEALFREKPRMLLEISGRKRLIVLSDPTEPTPLTTLKFYLISAKVGPTFGVNDYEVTNRERVAEFDNIEELHKMYKTLCLLS